MTIEAAIGGTLIGIAARPARVARVHRLAPRTTGDGEQRIDAQVRLTRALAEATRRRDAAELELRLGRWGRLL